MHRSKRLLVILRNASSSSWAMLSSHEGRSMTSAMHHHPPRRAMLYVPGPVEKKIRKAASEINADSIVMDCEDGVAANMKDMARQTIALMLDDLDFGPSEAAVRINPVSSGLAEDDLSAVLSAKRLPDALVVPKVESQDEVHWILDKVKTLLSSSRQRPLISDTRSNGSSNGSSSSSSSDQQQWRRPMAFIPMCESAMALLNLRPLMRTMMSVGKALAGCHSRSSTHWGSSALQPHRASLPSLTHTSPHGVASWRTNRQLHHGPVAASAAAVGAGDSTPHTFLFTSESVTEGHPDKICDQVSDAVLDACLAQDPNSKVACETAVKDNFMLVFGEITSHADVDYDAVARQVCHDIGYNHDDLGFNANNMEVKVLIRQQVPEIAQSVHGMGHKSVQELGAGDQGHMFGYASDECPEHMPLSHMLASQLAARLAEVRKNGTCPWARPDGKTQVTIEYLRDGGHLEPLRVHTLLISTQHNPDISLQEVQDQLMQHVVTPVIPPRLLSADTQYFLNPSKSFVLGGPVGDAGLTGRKIIVDTYGGWGAHGGGAFSGKDPTKVDRSAAYVSRQAAKSVVAAGLANRCLVQVSYGIGLPHPLSVYVDTFKTGRLPDEEILEAVKEKFDFRPGMIMQRLDLQRGGNKRYQKTAAYGHFGRNHDPDFTWEQVVPLS